MKGLGMVTGVSVNAVLDKLWPLDYCIYAPVGDGKSKLDHVRDLLSHPLYQKQLPFQAVLMDTGYATRDLLLFIESWQKVYGCPLKPHRQVDDSGGQQSYRRMDRLIWSELEQQQGKQLKIKGVPKGYKVQGFRVAVSTHRPDFVVTNDWTSTSTGATQQACGFR